MSMGAIERWEGHRGFGPLNAKLAMDRAIELANEYGIGMVALGNLTTDPAAIEKTWRVLPMGYWKGSGISILLDLIATVLTNANSVQKIGTFGDEVGLSQIMIAIAPGKFQGTEVTDKIVEELVADIKSSIPMKADGTVFYPGEIEISARRDNKENGIPVIDEVWSLIQSL